MKKYIPFITITTLIYLIFELAFNAKLLDITGSLAIQSDIDAIEYYGRIISGIAVTLAVWGTILLPLLKSSGMAKKILVLSASAIIIIVAVYDGERALVDHIVSRSTGEQRKNAQILNILRSEVIVGAIDLTKINLTNNVLQTPEGKAFITLLPFSGMMIPNIDQKLRDPIHQAIQNVVSNQMGGNDVIFYNTKYQKASNGAMVAYGLYAQAVFKLRNKIYSRPDYNTEAYNIVGDFTPPGLSFEQFQMLPKIQKKAAEILQMKPPIKLGLSFDEYDTQIYKPLLDERVSVLIKKLDHPAKEYADGGEFAEDGRKSMEAVVAPALALAFSILGALVHVFKTGNYIGTWLRIRFRKTILLVVLIGGVLFFNMQSNEITSSEEYSVIQSNTQKSIPGFRGKIVNFSVKQVIQAEPYLYPFNEKIRRILHVKFGTI